MLYQRNYTKTFSRAGNCDTQMHRATGIVLKLTYLIQLLQQFSMEYHVLC